VKRKLKPLPNRGRIVDYAKYRFEILNPLPNDPERSDDPAKLVCRGSIGNSGYHNDYTIIFTNGRVVIIKAEGFDGNMKAAAQEYGRQYFEKNPPQGQARMV
jgi:hypothetical protein